MADRPMPTAAVTAFVGVGSNIVPDENVGRAVDMMANTFRLTGVSTFYRTAAIGPVDAPDFYNGVVRLGADGDAGGVAEALEDIEAAMGRGRTGDRYAPRIIDLDLLLWQGDPPQVESHPDVLSRAFVALPLLELAPDLMLPEGTALADLVHGFSPPGDPLPDLTETLRRRVRPWLEAP